MTRPRLLIALACLLLAALLTACAKPIPAERADYIGEWRGPDMTLVIRAHGEVHYERRRGNSRTSVKGPLKAFEGDDFSVGIGPASTTFVVSRAPYRDGDRWRMVVDGVELERNR